MVHHCIRSYVAHVACTRPALVFKPVPDQSCTVWYITTLQPCLQKPTCFIPGSTPNATRRTLSSQPGRLLMFVQALFCPASERSWCNAGYKVEHTVTAHSGGLQALDARGNFLATCGYGVRLGQVALDNTVKVCQTAFMTYILSQHIVQHVYRAWLVTAPVQGHVYSTACPSTHCTLCGPLLPI